MQTLEQALTLVFADEPTKLILSKPGKDSTYHKIVLVRKKDYYQVEKYTDKQVFHENVAFEEIARSCLRLMESGFGQCNGFSSRTEHIILCSKKGKVTYKKKMAPANKKMTADKVSPQSDEAADALSHNRKKNYLLPEGTVIPPLVDMGIFTSEGKVVRSMYDKFKQINRFVEIIDDTVRELDPAHLNIIDFGCGKSYLTFILYYYFTEIRHIPVQMLGLDLKEEVIQNCNKAARKYGYENLHFELGDINGYQCDFPVDMVITLHACDTATDFALYNAICWNAKMIFSVPCCQHEMNRTMKPENLSLVSHYGIIQERISALLTDALRADFLELCGYKTQVLEFIDLAHTPKNILIRAIKRPTTPRSTVERCRREIDSALKEFQVEPTLYRLLRDDERI